MPLTDLPLTKGKLVCEVTIIAIGRWIYSYETGSRNAFLCYHKSSPILLLLFPLADFFFAFQNFVSSSSHLLLIFFVSDEI